MCRRLMDSLEETYVEAARGQYAPAVRSAASLCIIDPATLVQLPGRSHHRLASFLAGDANSGGAGQQLPKSARVQAQPHDAFQPRPYAYNPGAVQGQLVRRYVPSGNGPVQTEIDAHGEGHWHWVHSVPKLAAPSTAAAAAAAETETTALTVAAPRSGSVVAGAVVSPKSAKAVPKPEEGAIITMAGPKGQRIVLQRLPLDWAARS
eukprot:TRINITY_DN25493_c0_g1_i1.p1 TRINITY_DN25493_c0_g1~~TRINITY_DN25493_c0_g1_i1.p1  ORF type:complete len:236 (-),score=20.93 TRINITY_DN25493_c0_g1_i1:569-1186(-)